MCINPQCLWSHHLTQTVPHAHFPKVCVSNSRKVGLLTKQLTKKLSYWEGTMGKNRFKMHWQSGGAFKTAAWVTLSVTLPHAHTHEATHTQLPLSFLACDSRHPAMTWGVFLAASKAALNRQKYLLWQTDRPSPTTTCMQLSLSLPLFFQTLCFDLPSCEPLSLSPLNLHFSSFQQLSDTILKKLHCA